MNNAQIHDLKINILISLDFINHRKSIQLLWQSFWPDSRTKNLHTCMNKQKKCVRLLQDNSVTPNWNCCLLLSYWLLLWLERTNWSQLWQNEWENENESLPIVQSNFTLTCTFAAEMWITIHYYHILWFSISSTHTHTCRNPKSQDTPIWKSVWGEVRQTPW